MGMGTSAAYADTVTEEFIGEIAPVELATLKSALEKEGNSMEDFAQDNQFGGDLGYVDFGDEVHQAYDELLVKFKEVTGLQLDVSHHDSESEGDRYDDVDGVFWTVGGVYQLTPAGKKYEDKITRSHYVIFG